METFEFRVLCSSHNACGEIMDGMKKMHFEKVVKTPKFATSDHSAILKLVDEDAAFEKAKELLSKYKTKIHDITVSVK